MKLDIEPLVEFGTPVLMAYQGREVLAQRDSKSGYVFFEAPDAEELNRYYQVEYPSMQRGYYTVETDYEPGKNRYHADRILEVFQATTGHLPVTSFELGCAYGGLVAEFVSRGVRASGADVNADAVAQGARVMGNRNLVHAGNLDALRGLHDKVDLIYSVHVLEHDPDLIGVIDACRNHLNPGGLLFVSLPNAMFIGSVMGGFTNNHWVNYPQHLHLLSPGFVPALCRSTGFLPMFWDTRILYEAQPSLDRHFSFTTRDETRRNLFNTMLFDAGYGMELNFALTPDDGRLSNVLAAGATAILGTLEAAARAEVKIRQTLSTALRPAPMEALAIE
ncbi:MAG: class I SAM-dependent methyltransferase [Janthinobacterium lividum]